MEKGVVLSFNEENGYGFVEGDDGEHHFVHHSAIEMDGFRTLARGDKVMFESVLGKRGPEAVRVRKI